MPISIIQIILGIILIIIALMIVRKVTKMIFFILLLGGLYSFSHGLITVGTLLNWWGQIFS